MKKEPRRTVWFIGLFLLLFLFAQGCTPNEPVATPPQNPAEVDPTPVEPTRKVFDFVAVGDNLIHYPIYEYAKKIGVDHYDFSSSYEPMKEVISHADIAFLNQEVTVAGEEYGISSYPLFNSPKELAADMANLGFDVVNQASNHSLDVGLQGLIASWRLWNELNVEVVGFFSEEQGAVQIIEREDVRFAFLGYNYGLNGFEVHDWLGYGMTFLDEEEQILTDVRHAKTIADFVIVSFHWGDEYSTDANEQQQHLAELLANENVDLIIGHHPHVLQPVELLTRQDGKSMPVFYSLGNFISNQLDSINLLGGMAYLRFIKDGDETSVESPQVVPLVTHYDSFFQATRVVFLNDYSEEIASQHGIHDYGKAFSVNILKTTFESIISEDFRGTPPKFLD